MKNVKTTLLILLILNLIACKKEDPSFQAVNLYDIKTSNYVPSDFLGFSNETSILTDTTYFNASNTKHVNLIKGLGVGILRLGGLSVDRTYWSNNRRKKSMSTDSLYTDDVDRFITFDKLTNWKVIWGLNLGRSKTSTAIEEAKYVSDRLNGSLYTFELGNEPDLYVGQLRSANYTYNDYLSEFKIYFNAIKSACPGVEFSGPAVAYHVPWVTSFADNTRGKIKMASLHYYRAAPLPDSLLAVNRLLTFDNELKSKIKNSIQATDQANIIFRLAECNSIANGGQKGASNTYVSTLWANEFIFYAAQNNVAGVNFHGGNNYYTPIRKVNNEYFASPIYYSLLFFKIADVRSFMKTDFNPDGKSVALFYFFRNDGKTALVVINKSDSFKTVLFKSNFERNDMLIVHKLESNSLTSTTGVTIDGSEVDKSGIWQPRSIDTLLKKNSPNTWTNNSLRVAVEPYSTKLIIIN